MASAQYYVNRWNPYSASRINTPIPITPTTPAPQVDYIGGPLAGYNPTPQAGGYSKITGQPVGATGGLIGGNMYNHMQATRAQTNESQPAAAAPGSFGARPTTDAAQLYANYMLAQSRLPNQLASMGLYGVGVPSESSQVALDSAYAQALDAYRRQNRQSGARQAQGGRFNGNSPGMRGVSSADRMGTNTFIGRDGSLNYMPQTMDSSFGGYQPWDLINPYGFDIVKTADGRLYNNTLGMSMDAPNYLSALAAYGEEQRELAKLAAGQAQTAASVSGGGGGGLPAGYVAPTKNTAFDLSTQNPKLYAQLESYKQYADILAANPKNNTLTPEQLAMANYYNNTVSAISSANEGANLANLGINTAYMTSSQITQMYNSIIDGIKSGKYTIVDVDPKDPTKGYYIQGFTYPRKP